MDKLYDSKLIYEQGNFTVRVNTYTKEEETLYTLELWFKPPRSSDLLEEGLETPLMNKEEFFEKILNPIHGYMKEV